jgi:hypothetical protein
MTTTPHTACQAEALALHNAGLLLGEIAAQMGVSWGRARDILDGLGVTPPSVPQRWPVSPRRESLAQYKTRRARAVAERRAQVADLVGEDPTITSAEMAVMCACSIATIQYDRRALGCPAPRLGA